MVHRGFYVNGLKININGWDDEEWKEKNSGKYSERIIMAKKKEENVND